jgi:hypothetical protein
MAQGNNNTALAVDVEAVVREVIRRLQLKSNEGAQVNTAISNGAHAAKSNQLVVTQRVVTLAELDGRLIGAAQVVVPKGAVVTPAAKDLLRQAGVALTYATGNTNSKTHRLTVGVAETNYEPAALLAAIEGEFTSIEQLARTGLVTVVDELAAQVALGGSLGLLITDKTMAGACLANRQRDVRAAGAVSTAEVNEAVGQLGANLLVIRPGRKSLAELKQMIATFARGGARNCPGELLSQLG